MNRSKERSGAAWLSGRSRLPTRLFFGALRNHRVADAAFNKRVAIRRAARKVRRAHGRLRLCLNAPKIDFTRSNLAETAFGLAAVAVCLDKCKGGPYSKEHPY
jgi:hypothetical protein